MVTKKIMSYIKGLGENKKKPSERQSRRLKAMNLIKFTLSDGVTYESISNIVDISETGLQFTCYESLQPDQPIKMLIHVPDAYEDIPIQGRLVWVRPKPAARGVYVAGIKFENIPAKSREVIRQMIAGEIPPR